MSGVTYVRGQATITQAGQCLAHMARGDIEEMHGIAVCEEPPRVHAGAPADIEDTNGWWGQMPTKDLLGANQLESGQPTRQSVLLEVRLVVRYHLGDVALHDHHRRGRLRTTTPC